MHLKAFGRLPLLDAASLHASSPIIGNVERLRRKLANGEPITMAAIGSSNVVRGGCPALDRPWRMGDPKCAYPKYTNRSADDGTSKGWLLQAYEAMQRTWPHPNHRLVNRALMATGPAGFEGCLNRFIPHDADIALLGFADVCNAGSLPLHNSTFGLQLEGLVRELAARADPPAIVFFNFHKFVSWSCTLEQGLCAFWMGCEAQLQELAQFYAASAISMRNAMYHRGAREFGGRGPRDSRRDFRRWTSDNGGHFGELITLERNRTIKSPCTLPLCLLTRIRCQNILPESPFSLVFPPRFISCVVPCFIRVFPDLGLGDKYAAEVLFHWIQRAAVEPPLPRPDEDGGGTAPGEAVAEAPGGGTASGGMATTGGVPSGGVVTLPRTFYSTRTCYHARERRYKPCLYDAEHPPGSAGTPSAASSSSSSSSSSSAGAAFRAASSASARASAAASGRPMSCYTFDDSFGGAMARPQVVTAHNWSYVETERASATGERRIKPGYRASTRGAVLLLSTRAAGAQEFALGYLSTRRASSRARVECVRGCVCEPLTLSSDSPKATSGDTTATTEFTPPHAAVAPAGGGACHVRLELESDGAPFKLVALHVRSALGGGSGDG